MGFRPARRRHDDPIFCVVNTLGVNLVIESSILVAEVAISDQATLLKNDQLTTKGKEARNA